MPWSRLTFFKLRHLMSFVPFAMLARLFIVMVTVMLSDANGVTHLMQKCFCSAAEPIAVLDLFLQPTVFCLQKFLDMPFPLLILSLLVLHLTFELLDRVFDGAEFFNLTEELGEIAISNQAFREPGSFRAFGHFLPRVSGSNSVYHWFCTLDDLSVESDVPNHLALELIDIDDKAVEGMRTSFHDTGHVPGSSEVIVSMVSGPGDIQ